MSGSPPFRRAAAPAGGVGRAAAGAAAGGGGGGVGGRRRGQCRQRGRGRERRKGGRPAAPDRLGGLCRREPICHTLPGLNASPAAVPEGIKTNKHWELGE